LQFSLYQNQKENWLDKTNFFCFEVRILKKTTTNKNIKFTHSQIKKQQYKIYTLRFKSWLVFKEIFLVSKACCIKNTITIIINVKMDLLKSLKARKKKKINIFFFYLKKGPNKKKERFLWTRFGQSLKIFNFFLSIYLVI